MPTFCTEQYPKGLGPTVPEIELAKYNILPISKTCFTMILPELMEKFKAAQPETKSVILCGIETQACITATTLGRNIFIALQNALKTLFCAFAKTYQLWNCPDFFRGKYTETFPYIDCIRSPGDGS